MPDCSQGMQSNASTSQSGQAQAHGSQNNPERCNNCEVLEARIQDAQLMLREVKSELRRKVRELRNKREKINLILLTVIDICDQGSPKLNRRAIEQKVKNPAFMRESILLANTIASLLDRYRGEVDFDSDFQTDDEE